MNKKQTRLTNLEEILRERKLVSIKDMAHLLGVSEMTVRRDIRQMEMASKVKNLNGMLISSADNSFSMLTKQYELHSQAMDQNLEKEAIGAMAATRISTGDSVMLDVGSTVEQIARHVSKDIKFEALCLTLNTMQRLLDKPLATVAVSGGYYQPSTQMFLSDESIRFIRSIRANKVFLSAAGIHEELGISCANHYEVVAKKALLQSARHHILVADSSKFGVIRSAHFCDLNEIDEIITDDRLPDRWVNLIESRNILLHRVPIGTRKDEL